MGKLFPTTRANKRRSACNIMRRLKLGGRPDDMRAVQALRDFCAKYDAETNPKKPKIYKLKSETIRGLLRKTIKLYHWNAPTYSSGMVECLEFSEDYQTGFIDFIGLVLTNKPEEK